LDPNGKLIGASGNAFMIAKILNFNHKRNQIILMPVLLALNFLIMIIPYSTLFPIFLENRLFVILFIAIAERLFWYLHGKRFTGFVELKDKLIPFIIGNSI
jgi:hypothetical protein